jgi:protein involved in polysaccharide export with SLBB domain
MRLHKFSFLILGIILMFFGTLKSQAQDILKGKDLSQLKVDLLSDAEIAKLKGQLNSSGMSVDMAEQIAISKGLPAAEAAKLKQRISSSSEKSIDATFQEVSAGSKANNASETLDVYSGKAEKPLINPLIFGSELYTSVAPSFEPNLKAPTPLNYLLGPDDQLLISVYGVQEYNGTATVSTEGIVTIPSVGQVRVAGLSIEAATQKLKTVMSNGPYGYLKSGGAKLSVSLAKIRSIRVTIIGANRPGNFNVSSLSTVFNALFVAGGPSIHGSFREIELIRNNKLERIIDLYRFLTSGDQSDNIGLRDNDVIRIPTYKKRVELQGEVKRPGIYEVLPNETFSKILSYASGFTESAYKASVKVYQFTDKEKKLNDLALDKYPNYQPNSGDAFVVSKILNRYNNRVSIKGAIFRPNDYELTNGMRLADLIKKSDGLREDAFTGRGQILRLQEDLTRSMLSFDLRKVLSGDDQHNFILQQNDEVIISSIFDLKDGGYISIQGEVRKPGQFAYIEKLTLKDLIIQAGGFTDAANNIVEIARFIKRDSLAFNDNRASEIIRLEFNEKDLSTNASNMHLLPFDLVTVRRKAGYILPSSVSISGQIQFPGPYVLSNESERLTDIINRSGGLLLNAYPEGAYINRIKTSLDKEKNSEALKTLSKNTQDSSVNTVQNILEDKIKIPLSLDQKLTIKGSEKDILMRAGDEIVIPKFDEQVKVSGEVLLPTQVPFDRKKRFKTYLSEAGGFTINAIPKRTFVVYANGRAATISSFLFFRSYPTVLPGSEIVVPKKRERKPATTAEIVGISTSVISLFGLMIALLK